MRKKQETNAWRKPGDPSLPGLRRDSPKSRTRAPKDSTYGSEPDMLDQPGTIVEPDVREKISKYFRSMRLREWIREIILEES